MAKLLLENGEIFEGKSSLVTVKVKGTKEIVEIKIENQTIESDEIELLQDMLLVAINDAMKQIDKKTEEKLGKYTQGLPGIF